MSQGALALATRIAVLDAGMLEVIPTPAEFAKVTTPLAQSFLDTLRPLDEVS